MVRLVVAWAMVQACTHNARCVCVCVCVCASGPPSPPVRSFLRIASTQLAATFIYVLAMSTLLTRCDILFTLALRTAHARHMVRTRARRRSHHLQTLIAAADLTLCCVCECACVLHEIMAILL